MRQWFFIFALFANAFSSIISLSLDGSIAPSGSSDLVILGIPPDSSGITLEEDILLS